MDRKAGYWDDSLGLVTLGAIDPLIEAVEVGPGVRVLDIACGTGALAAAAARRGASIIGMDFAPTMIGEAIRRYPGIDFRVGDAEAIPLADASVDAVTCSFGMLHMERPERVLVEVARVLRPVTGRFAVRTWTCVVASVARAVSDRPCRRMPIWECRYLLPRRCFALGTKVIVVQPCSLRVSLNPVSKSYPSSGPVTHHRRSSTLSTGAR